MRPETKLADVFRAIVAEGEKVDSVAGRILAIVTEEKVRTVEEFNQLVSAAYQRNGWNPRPGRPAGDAKDLDEVPGTVRTYVTTVRRALRRGIPVAKCKTFYEVRAEIRKAKVRALPNPTALPQEVKDDFRGVTITKADAPNGALVHDVGFVYEHLPRRDQEEFRQRVEELIVEFYARAVAGGKKAA